ncbi:hypothetical protein SO802_007703 [Lithocarpus litseifolius]|uniref:Uncharacterized protein n=1 Tax=Lithocarpus litseifolius TaxID=425828 RepID=A0AAW2DTK3_9ROSI
MDPHQQGPSIRDVLTRQDVHRSSLLWDAPLADERVPGVLTCRRREKGLFEGGLDPRIAAYITDAGLDGLLRVPNIDVDHALITALVERWRPETHSFHLPHGEMTITLQDIEVIMGVPVVGLPVVGFTRMDKWADLCAELLGHRPLDRELGGNRNTAVMEGPRVKAKWLEAQFRNPLPADATEMRIQQYARFYILEMLAGILFMDKSGERHNIMYLQFFNPISNGKKYSWGSAALSWLYRHLCKASEKTAKQIGGAVLLVQLWAWVRFPHMCPVMRHPHQTLPPGPLAIRSVMDSHFFYVYYDGEMYYHELHGLSYQGSNQKQKCVKVKRGIGLMNLQRRIFKAMRLDHSRHNMSIVYRAPQRVVDTQVFYNSLQLSGGTEVKMMWELVEQMVARGFIGSDLYVTVEPAVVEAGESSQHTVLDGTVNEHIDSIPLQSYQGWAENTGDGYGSEPWQTFPHVNSTEEEEGPQQVHEGEPLSPDELHGGTSPSFEDDGLGDDATNIDVTRDDFEELLDTMGEHEDVDHIEDVVVEENRDTCPGPDPTPEWFTKNTWDNMFDPSPVMQAEVSSWMPGEQPVKGMVFATKLVVRHALTWYAVRENFSFKTEHSDSKRLMVSCEDDSCPWSVRAICCKGDNVWKIAKCKGPHTCDNVWDDSFLKMFIPDCLAFLMQILLAALVIMLEDASAVLLGGTDGWKSEAHLWDDS